MVALRTKQTYRPPILPIKCFEAFKDCLPIVQRAEARGNLDVAERENARRLPKAIFELKHEHVVREDLPKTQFIKVNLFQLAVRSLRNLDFHLILLGN